MNTRYFQLNHVIRETRKNMEKYEKLGNRRDVFQYETLQVERRRTQNLRIPANEKSYTFIYKSMMSTLITEEGKFAENNINIVDWYDINRKWLPPQNSSFALPNYNVPCNKCTVTTVYTFYVHFVQSYSDEFWPRRSNNSDGIFKYIMSLTKCFCLYFNSNAIWSSVPFINKQIKAWRRSGDKSFSEPKISPPTDGLIPYSAWAYHLLYSLTLIRW